MSEAQNLASKLSSAPAENWGTVLSLSVPPFPHLGSRSLSQSDRESRTISGWERLGVRFPSLVEFRDQDVQLRRPSEGSLSWKCAVCPPRGALASRSRGANSFSGLRFN